MEYARAPGPYWPGMTTPLACDLTVFTAEERARLRALARRVFDAASAAEDLPDGYRLRFTGGRAGGADDPGADGIPLAPAIAEWITLERRCCRCIAFAIEFEAEGRPISVRMAGGPGVKPFILAEFGQRLAAKLPRTRP